MYDFQFWKCVSLRYYVLVHNMIFTYTYLMMIMREGKNGFAVTKFNLSRIKPSSMDEDQSQEEMHELQSPSKKVAYAFAKAEQDNDEMIIKMRDIAISKITSSIIQAEKLNDVKLKEMISVLPNYESHIIAESPYDLNELSSELASHLK